MHWSRWTLGCCIIIQLCHRGPKVNSVSATGLLKGYQVSSVSSAGLVNQVQARPPTNPTLEYYYIGEMVLPWNSEVRFLHRNEHEAKRWKVREPLDAHVRSFERTDPIRSHYYLRFWGQILKTSGFQGKIMLAVLGKLIQFRSGDCILGWKC